MDARLQEFRAARRATRWDPGLRIDYHALGPTYANGPSSVAAFRPQPHQGHFKSEDESGEETKIKVERDPDDNDLYKAEPKLEDKTPEISIKKISDEEDDPTPKCA